MRTDFDHFHGRFECTALDLVDMAIYLPYISYIIILYNSYISYIAIYFFMVVPFIHMHVRMRSRKRKINNQLWLDLLKERLTLKHGVTKSLGEIPQ